MLQLTLRIGIGGAEPREGSVNLSLAPAFEFWRGFTRGLIRGLGRRSGFPADGLVLDLGGRLGRGRGLAFEPSRYFDPGGAPAAFFFFGLGIDALYSTPWPK
jgi:hypothetical protein